MRKYKQAMVGAGCVRSLCVLLILGLVSACTGESDPEDSRVAEPPVAQIDIPETERRSAERPTARATASRNDSATFDARQAPDPTMEPVIPTNARDLLSELQTLEWDGDPESEARMANLLQKLRLQGADALIPLRDYLLEDDGSATGSPELRRVLLDVLLYLGLPEVEGIALELLSSKPAAMEVWQLGQYLEAVQPGRYSDSIRTVAEQALIHADPATILPGEYFQFLGELGNDQTALLLSVLPMHQEAYGSLALAAIPDGSGVPLLAQDARAFATGQDTMQGRLAVQLLAQQAPQFPEAAAVLIELAQQGVIPHDLWPYVLDIVAGTWELTTIQPPPNDLLGSHTYYHEQGDQVIFRIAQHQPETVDGLQSQRLYLLDRLQPFAPPELTLNPGG